MKKLNDAKICLWFAGGIRAGVGCAGVQRVR